MFHMVEYFFETINKILGRSFSIKIRRNFNCREDLKIELHLLLVVAAA